MDSINAINCIDTFSLANECGVLLDLKVFLEGCYDASTGLMYDSLRSQNLIPVNQPFNTSPWNYAGLDTVASSVLAVTGNDAVVDWILVRMTDPTNFSNQITKAALVQRDGDVIDGEGNYLNLGDMPQNGLFSIVQRNHLGVQTKFSIGLHYMPTTIDFTNPALPTFGTNAQNLISGIRAMWGGDANSDGKVNVVDKNHYWIFQNGMSGSYSNVSDFDLNGTVNLADKNVIWLPNNSKQSKCPTCY